MSDTPSNSRAAYAVAPERADGQLLDVGQKCSAIKQNCNVVDFLPYRCDHCRDLFCQDHRLPESHACEKWDANAMDRRALECPLCSELIAIPPGEDPNIKLGRHVDNDCTVMTGKTPKKSTTPSCPLPRCRKVLWQPIACDKCHKQFCASHRYPREHHCPSLSTPATTLAPMQSDRSNPLANLSSQTSARSAAAMAALKRSFASTNLGGSPVPSPSMSSKQTKSAPALGASSSTSSEGSSGHSKPKIIPLSSKDRYELPASLDMPLSTLTSPPAAAASDTAALTSSKSTSPSTTTNSIDRCVPTFANANPYAFIPRPLFARARAVAERKSQIRAMQERQRRGLLSPQEQERLKALEESMKDDKDCVVM